MIAQSCDVPAALSSGAAPGTHRSAPLLRTFAVERMAAVLNGMNRGDLGVIHVSRASSITCSMPARRG